MRVNCWALSILLLLPLLPIPARANPQGDALYKSASAKETAGDHLGAIKDAEAAVQADPALWQAWQIDGNARMALGDQPGAVAVYKNALAGNPNNPSLRAYVDSLSGPAAAPAVAVSPGEVSYQDAVAKYSAGNQDAALQSAAAAVRADPKHWQAWQVMGNIRVARGDKKGALEAYDKSLALHPDNPPIHQYADSLRTEVAAAPAAPAAAVTPSTEEASASESSFLTFPPPGRWGIGGHGGLLGSGDALASSLTYVAGEGSVGYGKSLSMRVNFGVVLVPSDPGDSDSTTVTMWGVDLRWVPWRWRLRPFIQGGYGSMTFSNSLFSLSLGLIRVGAGLEFSILPNLVASLEGGDFLGKIIIIPIAITEVGLSLRYFFGGGGS